MIGVQECLVINDRYHKRYLIRSESGTHYGYVVGKKNAIIDWVWSAFDCSFTLLAEFATKEAAVLRVARGIHRYGD